MRTNGLLCTMLFQYFDCQNMERFIEKTNYQSNRRLVRPRKQVEMVSLGFHFLKHLNATVGIFPTVLVVIIVITSQNFYTIQPNGGTTLHGLRFCCNSLQNTEYVPVMKGTNNHSQVFFV